MEKRVGTAENPLRVAVIGTGPSGMFAAGALLASKDIEVRVDLFDRLPAPFGLVRYGVAPDHQKIKNVIKVFDRTARDERVRFFGNVRFGSDLTRADLLDHYHQIVYAVGAQGDRPLGIEGEDLEGSVSSTEFVNWYNCHPDLCDVCYTLEHESVAVIGIGNVAMDVTRILAKRADDLATTDISDVALEELRKEKIREVWIIARRGPVQAKCTPGELQEIGDLEGVQVIVDPKQLELDPASVAELEQDRSAQKNMELFRKFAEEPEDPSRRHVRILFLASPVKILGDDGKVTGLQVERNRLVAKEDGRISPMGTGEVEILPTTMVIRAVGYRSNPLPELPFDERNAVIPNAAGRVVGEEYANDYVVGWIKRGPTGLIGTNKGDANETVASMVADAATLGGEKSGDVADLLREKGVRWVTYEEWSRLDEHEIETGKAAGRPRVKLTRIDEMLERLGAG
ncbi:MAG: NADP oxidoreductase [Acidobacteria bacterium]|nr:NADP oxidoreductase [Acidobacteriota bacterium]